MALNNYITQVQRLLHDPNATYYNTTDLTAFINLARGQVAIEGQCIRYLLPSVNGISSITVNTGGNYAGTPSVVITGPGTGAAAHAVMVANAVSQIVVDTAGSGYDNTTTITFTGGTPTTAATATAVILCNNTVTGQEVYTFSGLASVAQTLSGVQGIIAVRSIAVSWGSMKPMLEQWVWTDFQAYLRSNNTGLQSWPAVWANFGQGVNGSVYVYPLPSQVSQWDWDCVCYPVDLTSDVTPEAIPYPWTDPVQFYAAFLAYDNSQRKGDADRMFANYERFMKRARAMSEIGFVPDPYDQARYY